MFEPRNKNLSGVQRRRWGGVYVTKRAEALRQAVVTIAGALVSFALIYPLCVRFGAGASPAVLAVALAIGLGRGDQPADASSLLRKLVALPLVALAAAAVGLTLVAQPLAGAILFTAGIVLSIWLRNFGARGREVGRVVALPFITMLVVPVGIDSQAGPAVTAAFVIAAGAVAMICASILSRIASRTGFLRRPTEPRFVPPPREARATGLPVATRMALQMLVALALAFGIGFLLLPAHWSWVVLSAFIVCSGAIGRGDAIYKGILRVAGAACGTLAAALLQAVAPRNAVEDAVLIFALLFAGIYLRAFSYAYWAACVTLVFALLQGDQHGAAFATFALRLGGIAIGALCAIAATWFVFPIRTEQVVRRRVADALAALRGIVAAGGTGDPWHPRHAAMLDHHASELDRVAPPVRLHRRVIGSKSGADHPATLIERAQELLALARSESTDRAHLGAKMRSLGSLLRGEKD